MEVCEVFQMASKNEWHAPLPMREEKTHERRENLGGRGCALDCDGLEHLIINFFLCTCNPGNKLRSPGYREMR